MADELRQLLAGPQAGRVVRRHVRLVLRHHHPDLDDLLRILLDVAGEIERQRVESLLIVLDAVLRSRTIEVAVEFHPRWRRPRRAPEFEVRADGFRGLDVGNQPLAVALDAEILHRIVALLFIERV